jgi:hypothetical protein
MNDRIGQTLMSGKERCLPGNAKQAENYRIDREEAVTALRAFVPMSVKAALRKMDEKKSEYMWAKISEADVLFLTSDKERRVLKAYRDAIPKDSAFAWDAAKGQLELFEELGFKAKLARSVISDDF